MIARVYTSKLYILEIFTPRTMACHQTRSDDELEWSLSRPPDPYPFSNILYRLLMGLALMLCSRLNAQRLVSRAPGAVYVNGGSLSITGESSFLNNQGYSGGECER